MNRNIIEYKSKRWTDKILQVHVQHTLDGDRYMYRFKDTDNIGKAVLTAFGIPIKEMEFQDIEKEELERQLTEYEYKRIRKK